MNWPSLTGKREPRRPTTGTKVVGSVTDPEGVLLTKVFQEFGEARTVGQVTVFFFARMGSRRSVFMW